jgi:hypothetical protein
MKNVFLYIIVWVFIILLHGCIAKSNIDIRVPSPQKDVVVECYLTPGHPAELALAESKSFEDELFIQTLVKANVSIETDSGIIQLKDKAYRNSERQIFINYSSEDTVRDNHLFFNLDITTSQGVKMQASTGIVPQVKIQNISIGNHEITVGHNIDNVGDQYFKLHASTFKDGKLKQTKFELFHQNGSIPGPCTLPWKDVKAGADSIIVTLFHIQKDYYDYLLSVRYANSAYKDPFLTPELIKSNIKGGIGIFTYYTFEKRRISL